MPVTAERTTGDGGPWLAVVVVCHGHLTACESDCSCRDGGVNFDMLSSALPL
jgi:hypothetical protein